MRSDRRKLGYIDEEALKILRKIKSGKIAVRSGISFEFL